MTGSRPKIKTLIADVLLWCALCALLATGISNARAVGRMYTPFSLRFDPLISGQAAVEARKYSIETGGETFWPSFWSEGTALFSVEFAEARADCIFYSGDASLIWPAEYVEGAPPGVTDGNGCAVSEALAHTLWGGTDVVGKIVEADGKERIVRGVFAGGHELALIALRDEDTSRSWSAAELSGGPQDAARGDADSFASASGLGKPENVLAGGGPAFLTGALAVFPVIILCVYWLILFLGFLGKQSKLAARLLPFLLIFIFAAALPRLLDSLPGYLIPSRWSDFSFWSGLIKQAGETLREFLSAEPALRDVECKTLLIRQIAFSFFAVCCAVAACFRWHIMARSGAD